MTTREDEPTLPALWREIQGHVFRQVHGHDTSMSVFVDHTDPKIVKLLSDLWSADLIRPQAQVSPDRVNVAVGFTHAALEHLLPGAYRPLPLFGTADASDPSPKDPFQEGMRARGHELDDVATPDWKGNDKGLLLWISGRSSDVFDIYKTCIENTEIAHWQETGHWWPRTATDPNELLLGFKDGTSQPFVRELWTAQPTDHPEALFGGGTVTPDGWKPVPAGEFVLGMVDAANVRESPSPRWLTDHGTFLVYRTYVVHRDRFENLLQNQTTNLAGVEENLSQRDVAAKLMGRYQVEPSAQDGAEEGHDSLINRSPGTNGDKWNGREPRGNNDFGYAADTAGFVCPLGAHIRRSNPRDALGFHGDLVERHRIIRRGSFDTDAQEGKQTLHFIAINARINDGFEFIQQQWLNTGHRFRLGTAPDVFAGSRQTSGDRVTFAVNGEVPTRIGSDETLSDLIGGAYFLMPGHRGLMELIRKINEQGAA